MKRLVDSVDSEHNKIQKRLEAYQEDFKQRQDEMKLNIIEMNERL